MAFFAPIIAAVSTFATSAAGTAAIAAVTAASGVAGAIQAKGAGQVANAEYKIQANQVGDAARQREIERRRSLLSSLATQNATAGAQGVGIQGSNAAIAQTDINNARNDLLYDAVNTKTQQRVLRARGANAQRAGNLQAINSLVDTGQKLFDQFAPRKKQTKSLG